MQLPSTELDDEEGLLLDATTKELLELDGLDELATEALLGAIDELPPPPVQAPTSVQVLVQAVPAPGS